MTATVCSACGAKARALAAPGCVHIVRDTDIAGLQKLYHNELDEARCDACGTGLGMASTILVIFPEWNKIGYVEGPLSSGQARSLGWRRIFEAPSATDPDFIQFANAEELRKSVTAALSTRLDVFKPLSRADNVGRALEFFFENWRMFSSSAFAAAFTSLTANVSGLVLLGAEANRDRAELQFPALSSSFAYPQEIFGDLLRLQIWTWIRLYEAWADPAQSGNTLEADLDEYVHAGAVDANVLKPFQNALNGSIAELDERPNPYLRELLRAAVYAAVGERNPNAVEWAQCFFAHELACMQYGEAIPSELAVLRISGERAHATIDYESAWHAASGWLELHARGDHIFPQSLNDIIPHFNAVVAKLGYPELMPALLKSNLRIETSGSQTVADIIGEMREMVRHNSARLEKDPRELLAWCRLRATKLIEEAKGENLEQLADAIIEALGDSPEARADVESWLGSLLAKIHDARSFIARVNETPQPWEESLPDLHKARLMNSRSRVLRKLGQHKIALELQKKAVEIFRQHSSLDEYNGARVNLAQCYSEFRFPDRALSILEDVIWGPDGMGPDIDVLTILAVVYAELGQSENALRTLEVALEYASGQPVREVALQVLRAQQMAALNRFEQAMQILLDQSFSYRGLKADDGSILLSEAGAWITLSNKGASLSQKAKTRIKKIWKQIEWLASDAAQERIPALHLSALRLMAELNLAINKKRNQKLWRDTYDARLEYGLPAEAPELIELAIHAYRRGDANAGRTLIQQVPDAIENKFGEATDKGWAVGEVAGLKISLARLADTIYGAPRILKARKKQRTITGAEFEELRFVSELQRDAIGRTGLYRTEASARKALAEGLPNRLLSRLAPKHGLLAVVEWITNTPADAPGRYAVMCLLTLISATGAISGELLEQIDEDPVPVAAKLRTRLANWRPGRKGDPFDLLGWQRYERWIVEVLSHHLSEDDHVVFIRHEAFDGLPWHVAVGPRWTCSYASSWTELWALIAERHRLAVDSVGVLAVPRFGEDRKLFAAIQASVKRTQRVVAGQENVSLRTALLERGDLDAFRDIVQTTDIAKLVCHGYVDSKDGEVSLMLAHGGALPLAHSVAAASEEGKLHRLSWRDCEELNSASPYVFSAACSSGTVHVSGLGDQLGLFRTLRQAGTRAYIAPAWDIVATSVLPVLDGALERYISGVPLGRALRFACLEACTTTPRWLAWALTLQGDWR